MPTSPRKSSNMMSMMMKKTKTAPAPNKKPEENEIIIPRPSSTGNVFENMLKEALNEKIKLEAERHAQYTKEPHEKGIQILKNRQ